jgi:hypothetical protein
MLWYKAWLETRWRFVFMMASMLFIAGPLQSLLGAPPERMWGALRLGSFLLCCLAAIYLAGSGVNSQTTYAATSGFHGSMLFTLSLPVSRRRLFLVRAALGALETCAFIILSTCLMLAWRPVATGAMQAATYIARTILCTMAVYAVSALLACVLDEMWQFTGTCMLVVGVGLLQSKSTLIAQISPLKGIGTISYPINAPMPWPALATSLVLTVILTWVSVAVLQRKEY